MNYYGPRELQTRTDDGETEPAGTYHYTRRNNSRIWPLGYCAGKPVTTREGWDEKMGMNSPTERYDEGWDSSRADDDKKGLRVNRTLVDMVGEKYHDHGHDSKEEAVECYTEYCFDLQMGFYFDEETEWRRYHGVRTRDLSEPVTGSDIPPDVKGKECHNPDCDTIVGYPTMIVTPAGSTGHEYHLCDTHCTRESVAEWWTAPAGSISSW